MGKNKKIVPPAPCWRRRENEILREIPSGLGLVLWQDLRHVRDWLHTEASRRGALFHPDPPARVRALRTAARAEAPDLAEALDGFLALTRAPLAADVQRLAGACQLVAEWAEEREHTQTAVQFAEAAALADPDVPRRANMAGRITRNACDFSAAEEWFERGIGLARKRKEWVEYTRGHLGYGILCMLRERDRRARQHLNTAANTAMREGYEWLAAEAQHDLFRFMAMRGHYSEAEMHARRALAWYPKHHPRFPFFVADVAFLLICVRHFTSAIKLLRRFVRMVNPPRNVLGVSLLVRALAGAGRWKEFESMRATLLELLCDYKEFEAAARWNLAEAERAAGLWEMATANARAAVKLARAQRDNEIARHARTTLTGLRRGMPAPGDIHSGERRFSELLDALTLRLSEWAPTRRGRSPSLSRTEWAA